MTPVSITREQVQGATGPCTVYSGLAAAIKTRAGVDVVLLCVGPAELRQVIEKINPGQPVDPSKFYPVSLIHDSYIKRENEL